MSETGPHGTQPLPVVEADPAADPAVLNPAEAGQPGAPGAEGSTGMPIAEDEPLPERDSYVQKSREAYQDAKEQGKQLMQDVGRAAVGKVVRRKRGSSETTGDGESTTGDPEATRASWKERASAAKGRAATRLENRWEKRQQERETARKQRIAEHTRRKDARETQRRQEDVDRRADRLDDQMHKATMTRKEFNQYKYNKQARKDKERDDKMWADWRAQQEAKKRAKQQKAELKVLNAAHKENRKFDKHQAREVAKAHSTGLKENERFDRGRAKAAQLKAERDMIAALRDDPEAYAQFLEKQADAKREKRHARVMRAQKVGGKILHAADVATKVAVGAAVSGTETARRHGKNAAEALSNDERVQYAKFRAELGSVAVRKWLGESLANAGGRILPTAEELDKVAQTGELPLTEDGAVELSVEINHDEDDAAAAEPKVPAAV